MEAGVQQGGGKLREKLFHYLLEMGRLFFSLGLGSVPMANVAFVVRESTVQHSDKHPYNSYYRMQPAQNCWVGAMYAVNYILYT